jgi:hypothetical protein
MKTYDTISEALADLKQRGYSHDFNLMEIGVECKELDRIFDSTEFEAVEVHRFEGMTNPSDSAVLYVIETTDGVKGAFVDAYGAYGGALSSAMIRKMRIHHPDQP